MGVAPKAESCKLSCGKYRDLKNIDKMMYCIYNIIKMYIQFILDDNKAEENVKKHGISFEEAKTSFYDPNARVYFDGNKLKA